MPERHLPLRLLLPGARPVAIGLLVAALASVPVSAQNFVAVSDSTNPIVSANVSGTFTGASWVDVDDDGLLDLFICRKDPIYRNLGGGTFVKEQDAIFGQGRPVGNTWSDYDNDGDIDCFTSGGPWVDKGSFLWRNDGGFQFTRIEGPEGGDVSNTLDNTGWGSAFADVDNDGYTDIMVAAANGFSGVTHENVLLLNDGDGSFTSDDTTPITDGLDAYTVPTFSDYDFDGDQDLFIGSGEISQLDPDNLYRNLFQENGTFGFERILTAPIATDLLDGQVWNWIDYDNDGDLDAFQTNYNFGLSNNLYRNDGGTYVKTTPADVGEIVNTNGAALSNVWMDFDNDGDLDCLVTNAGTATNEYWVNDGDGTFTADAATEVVQDAGPHYGATAGDWDNDGDVDLYVHGSTATKRLYRNDLANGNAWLNIKLRGAGAPLSNGSAIGARVRAVATIGGQVVAQLREVSAQNSFCSMNMLNVHFGLGDAAVVDTLEITWPAGGVTVLTDVAPNQFLDISEGGQTGVATGPAASGDLALRGAPNPFRLATTVEFALPSAADVSLSVFDVAGRRVATLADGRLDAGRHRVEWDGRAATGRRLGSGVYFYRLEAAGLSAVRKVVVLD